MPSTHPSNGPRLDSNPEWLDAVFTFHEATPEDVGKYLAIRTDAKNLVETILNVCPGCADTSAAIRKVREAVMTANAAVALEGK